MARPKVPKCKECNYLTDLRHPSDAKGCYKCTINGKHYNDMKYINGQEVRTSPKWCPLRYRK